MLDLIERTPADGMIGGLGTVNGRPVIAMSYDYTVLAGTQGTKNHYKKDRLFELAEQLQTPVVFLTEGGGGRPLHVGCSIHVHHSAAAGAASGPGSMTSRRGTMTA